MGDQSGANAKFAAPQDEGLSASEQSYFDASVLSAALERWVMNYGDNEGCETVPEQRKELRFAG